MSLTHNQRVSIINRFNDRKKSWEEHFPGAPQILEYESTEMLVTGGVPFLYTPSGKISARGIDSVSDDALLALDRLPTVGKVIASIKKEMGVSQISNAEIAQHIIERGEVAKLMEQAGGYMSDAAGAYRQRTGKTKGKLTYRELKEALTVPNMEQVVNEYRSTALLRYFGGP